jgi:iron complex transport system substrate-binding protein
VTGFSFVRIVIAAAVMAAANVVFAAEPAHAEIRVTDITGRDVALPEPAKRVVLGPWVSLDALSLLSPDPVALLAGWGGSVNANTYQPAILRTKFPGVEKIPVIGKSMSTASLESILVLRPDLVVLSRMDVYGPTGEGAAVPVFGQLVTAGVPVLIVDFFLDPLANTVPSVKMLGQALGLDERANAFAEFYDAHLSAIDRRIAAQGEALRRPAVFFHAFAARPACCFSAGPGIVDGWISRAGGHNIGADILKAPIGQVSIEYVYAQKPDIYIATASSDPAGSGEFLLGPDIEREIAVSGFRTLTNRADIAAIDSVRNGRAHGLWHMFVHTPLNIVALELLASWIHPELFSDIDPAHTLDEINGSFLAAPVTGVLQVSSEDIQAK